MCWHIFYCVNLVLIIFVLPHSWLLCYCCCCFKCVKQRKVSELEETKNAVGVDCINCYINYVGTDHGLCDGMRGEDKLQGWSKG